ncbi:MAG: hypothetical protein LH647_21200, partial [Leptolyngbyaceae cyanobacterium CAN_BIN12]|nr:hypothetical protein [Leptolyngbyaceae cyanobacterium CAN_BIN12]
DLELVVDAKVKRFFLDVVAAIAELQKRNCPIQPHGDTRDGLPRSCSRPVDTSKPASQIHSD